MNERDKELADEAEAYAYRDFKGEINWSEAYESKLIALIRADELEAAEDRVVDLFANMETPYLPDITRAIRARGNT